MLVLTRKVNEQVVFVLGGRVVAETTVIRAPGVSVRLGFDAPPDVEIFRKEVWERIQCGEEEGS